jgi:hypothetical protein
MYKNSKAGIWKRDLSVKNERKPFIVVIHRSNNRFKNKSVWFSPFTDRSRSFVIQSDFLRRNFIISRSRTQVVFILMIYVNTALMKVHVITLITLHFKKHFTSMCNTKTRYYVWNYKRKQRRVTEGNLLSLSSGFRCSEYVQSDKVKPLQLNFSELDK